MGRNAGPRCVRVAAQASADSNVRPQRRGSSDGRSLGNCQCPRPFTGPMHTEACGRPGPGDGDGDGARNLNQALVP